jgi:hypothetical protein
MRPEIHELSDFERQEIIRELTDGVLMPVGELGAALLAAIFIVIFLWKTSGVT